MGDNVTPLHRHLTRAAISSQPCPHCEDLQERVAWLESELGIRRKAGDLLRLNRAFGLTPSEAAIVLALSASPLTVLAEHELLEVTQELSTSRRGAGDPDSMASRNLVRVQICRIRQKLGSDAVRTLHGRGYALSQEARARVAEVLAAR